MQILISIYMYNLKTNINIGIHTHMVTDLQQCISVYAHCISHYTHIFVCIHTAVKMYRYQYKRKSECTQIHKDTCTHTTHTPVVWGQYRYECQYCSQSAEVWTSPPGWYCCSTQKYPRARISNIKTCNTNISLYTPARSLDWPLRMNSLILPDMMENTLHTSCMADTVDRNTNQNHSRM